MKTAPPALGPFVVRDGGFSLVEVLMGMGVVGILVVSLSAGLSSGFSTVQLARENLRATQVLLEKMETIRLYTWDQITTPGFIPTEFQAPYSPLSQVTGSSGITFAGRLIIGDSNLPVAYSADLKSVTVEVSWVSGQVMRRRQMTTFIAKNGLQPYIY